MIRIKMKRCGKSVELKLPCKYEHVQMCLWKLGLDRDPSKYTLEELGAVFVYDTPDEHQMVRIISSTMRLLDALMVLSRMMEPPYPIAARIRAKIRSGFYNTAVAFLRDIEETISNSAIYQVEFLFPVTGELTDSKGSITPAPKELIAEYREMIGKALSQAQSQIISPTISLFCDEDGLYEKLLSARWIVEQKDDHIVGKVVLFLTCSMEEEEAAGAAERIEFINGMDLALRLKQWSVLTEQGLLFVDLCDEGGDYAMIPLDELEQEDGEEYDEGQCLCPDCQEKLRKQNATNIQDKACSEVLDPPDMEEERDE